MGVYTLESAPHDGRVFTLFAVRPQTGRQHQIRVHLASIGQPIVADSTYGCEGFRQRVPWCPRLFLHCRRMALRDLSGAAFAVEARLPEDLASALANLRLVEGSAPVSSPRGPPS